MMINRWWYVGLLLIFLATSLSLSGTYRSSEITEIGRKHVKVEAHQYSGLWIIIPNYGEGISGWRISLAEILVFAKMYNATLVTPSIMNGRLNTDNQAGMGIMELFDESLIEGFHPKLASYHDFLRLPHSSNETSTFRNCMNPDKTNHCAEKNLQQEHLIQLYSPVINDAIHRSRNRPEDIVILELNEYRQGWLSRLMFRDQSHTTMLIDSDEVNTVLRSILTFQPKWYDMADDILQSMGVEANQDYATFHWRAEKKGIQYMECARKLVDSKDKVLLGSNKNSSMPVVLMSSLNTDPNMEWGGAKTLASNSSAPEALNYLLNDGGFVKSDSSLRNYGHVDLIVTTVVDLIIAQRSTIFATCAFGCPPWNWCHQCNWAGKFGNLVINMRQEDQVGGKTRSNDRTSLRCWP